MLLVCHRRGHAILDRGQGFPRLSSDDHPAFQARSVFPEPNCPACGYDRTRHRSYAFCDLEYSGHPQSRERLRL
jgi:hypothetical protein